MTDMLPDSQWLWWLGAALALGAIEMLTLDLMFLMLAIGALVAVLAAAIGVPFTAQVVVFALSALLLLLFVRPSLRRRLDESIPHAPTNAAGLIGQEARVAEPVTELAGTVKLAGEIWTARPAWGGETFAVGEVVRVAEIDGATARIERVNRADTL
ncbi:Membrane protein implicated in regulation of membrane protease activity [Kytococcus aerolatus]|uniref:Membrane protein implicated in regulation of membrane protease activity n=1 Tax=Kytococcus aerolatus TaxID=592308 RepID=A0A212T6B5_9MICO|nr:NfeD family protein [Kytococcus aerolatus]SNC61597.1 Membrane protein implicated in regulation of membrane protease activity [Kytococcus aerolatus]